MIAEAIRHQEVGLTSPRTFKPPSNARVPAPLRHAAAIGSDVLAVVGVVFCIPFVLLAIGIPIALFVQLLLWFSRLL